jgi:hypothetical protein
MSDSPFSLKGEQSMAIMTITLKNSLKLADGTIVPAGKIFRGELDELPEWIQVELRMNSRVLEVERLRIPDVKKASISELKKDALITETQKSAPAEITLSEKEESGVNYDPKPVSEKKPAPLKKIKTPPRKLLKKGK